MTGVMAAAVALTVAPSAHAQPQASPLAQGLLDMPANDPQPAERYQTPDGRVRFVLDRSGQRLALVKFEGSDEVHVLRAVSGPRGDDFYKTDTGDVMLRVTALGSVIVYRESGDLGAPATSAGFAAPVTAPPEPQGGLRAWIEAMQRKVAQRGRPVTFEAPAVVQGPATGVVADAAARAADGLVAAPPGQTVTVRRVVIRYGNAPAAVVVNESLTITVAPQLGYAGRPSSSAVAQAVSQGPR